LLRCSIDAIEGATVGVIAPPQIWLKQVARFSPHRVVDRKLRASVEALVPLDGYRVAFLFQSLYLEDEMQSLGATTKPFAWMR
jgi:hypothetical protein